MKKDSLGEWRWYRTADLGDGRSGYDLVPDRLWNAETAGQSPPVRYAAKAWVSACLFLLLCCVQWPLYWGHVLCRRWVLEDLWRWWIRPEECRSLRLAQFLADHYAIDRMSDWYEFRGAERIRPKSPKHIRKWACEDGGQAV